MRVFGAGFQSNVRSAVDVHAIGSKRTKIRATSRAAVTRVIRILFLTWLVLTAVLWQMR